MKKRRLIVERHKTLVVPAKELEVKGRSGRNHLILVDGDMTIILQPGVAGKEE